MTLKTRESEESPIVQGENESIAYTLDITKWGSSPTNITMKVEDEDGSDVTAATTTGSITTPTTKTILLKELYNLTVQEEYRVEVQFDIADIGTIEAYFRVIAGE